MYQSTCNLLFIFTGCPFGPGTPGSPLIPEGPWGPGLPFSPLGPGSPTGPY